MVEEFYIYVHWIFFLNFVKGDNILRLGPSEEIAPGCIWLMACSFANLFPRDYNICSWFIKVWYWYFYLFPYSALIVYHTCNFTSTNLHTICIMYFMSIYVKIPQDIILYSQYSVRINYSIAHIYNFHLCSFISWKW